MNDLRRFALLVAPIAGLLLTVNLGRAIAAQPSYGATDALRARAAYAGPSLYLPPPAYPHGVVSRTVHTKIKHVIIIMQENRSFDDLWQGYPGANTQPYGYDSNGNQIQLQPIPLEAPYDVDHDIYAYFEACNGTGSIPGTNCRMNGFNNESNGCGGSDCTDPEYGYVPQTETTPYFAMAGQYVLSDNTFASHIDDSFISHQYIIAAQANDSAYFPSGAWGCEGGTTDIIATLTQQRTFGPTQQACWDINTLGDELDAAKKSWRFYTSAIGNDGGIWSAYQAIRHIYYGPDWTKDVITPHQQILTDIPNGILANVTWVMPTCETSDHAGCDSNEGPSWVTSVVNAVGQSKFWKSSAIFVVWDEWGGWYDHVAPPYLDYDGLGMRVGMLMISPYAKKNYVTHVQYEQASILHFTEDQFGLARLSASDARSTSPETDAFDFTKPPRKFQPIASALPAEYFIKNPRLDTRQPDDE